MRRRLIPLFVLVLVSVGVVSPSLASRRRGPCAVVLHQTIGTDDVVPLAPVPLPVDDVPTDVGFVKLYVACR